MSVLGRTPSLRASSDAVAGPSFRSAPTSRSTSRSSSPGAATASTSAIRPVVTVPVLSSTTVSIVRVDSRISGPLIRMPSCAPRPVPTITAPTADLTWAVGDDIDFAGSATDAEDGDLTAADLTWSLIVHHCETGGGCHEHGIEQQVGVDQGTFVAPDHEYPSHLEIRLTATDSAGGSATTSVELQPKTVDQTQPTDLQKQQPDSGTGTTSLPAQPVKPEQLQSGNSTTQP